MEDCSVLRLCPRCPTASLVLPGRHRGSFSKCLTQEPSAPPQAETRVGASHLGFHKPLNLRDTCPPSSLQCPSRCEHCAQTLRASSCSCLGTQKVISRGTTTRRPTKSKVQIRTRCWPPPGIAEVSLALSSPGPAPQDSIRGHRSWAGALVCSHATERQVDASGAGVLRPRGRSDALPHCLQPGAGSPPFWQKGSLLVPTL